MAHRQHDDFRRTDDLIQRDIPGASERDDQFPLSWALGRFAEAEGRDRQPMLRRRPDLPRHMPGGIDNPLGARAMYLGSTLYRIHGSNEPETIGQAVSSGCFRMTNEDVTDLYSRVPVGTRVVVAN